MIRIITDSSSDFDPEIAKELGLTIIPYPITFGDTEYLDRVTLSVDEFYQKLSVAEKLPTTSQITPFQFCKVFQPFLDAGDEIVGIFLSSELSGTFQSAMAAKEMMNTDRIFLVDSLNAALGQHLLVQIALNLKDQGLSASDIAEQITALTKKVRLVAYVKTMKYLVMGGRVSAAAAKIGSVLGITPIISVVGGKVVTAGKTHGHKAAHRWVSQYLTKEPVDPSYPIVFSHAAETTGRDAFVESIRSELPTDQFLYCDLGSTVGTHIGHGAVGIAYIAK